jgi:hypothetical protein
LFFLRHLFFIFHGLSAVVVGEQFWLYSKTGEIRRDEACLDYAGSDVILYPCHGAKGNQFWEYDPEVNLNKSILIGL